MTGTTVGGLVYPLSSEPVRDGATRMQYFLEQLDQDPVERDAYRTVGMNVPNTAWTKVTSWSGSTYSQGSNNDMQVTGSGVQCRKGGRYFLDARWTHPNANATGHMGIGIDVDTYSPGPTPPKLYRFERPLAAAGWEQQLWVSGTLSITAMAVVTIWCYQSGGATVVGSDFKLNVRQLRIGQAHA